MSLNLPSARNETRDVLKSFPVNLCFPGSLKPRSSSEELTVNRFPDTEEFFMVWSQIQYFSSALK